jgi:predicted RecA/RadA family phage recombinase
VKNFIQPGDSITVAAPSGGVTSGDLVVVNSLIGVAAATAAAGEDVVLDTEGVFELPKASADAIDVGDLLYSDDGELTKTPGTGSLPLAGAATKAAGAGVLVVNCKLGVHGITGPSGA